MREVQHPDRRRPNGSGVSRGDRNIFRSRISQQFEFASWAGRLFLPGNLSRINRSRKGIRSGETDFLARFSRRIAMRLRHLVKFARCWWRTAVATALVVSLLASAIGVRIPVRVAKESDRPFPCEFHNCGCLSADQCRNNCCCFSAAEKVAWANAHQVQATEVCDVAELREAVEHADHGTAPVALAKKRSCCAHGKASSASMNHAHAEDAALCHDEESAQADSSLESDAPLALQIVLAPPCRGLSPLWTVLSEALPGQSRLTWSHDRDPVGSVALATDDLSSQDFPPPVPPPKV